MARKKLDFTLKEINEEITTIADHIDGCIRVTLGENFYRSALGLETLSYEDNYGTDAKGFTSEDFSNSSLFHEVSCAYQYAEGIRYGDTNLPENFLDEMEEFTEIAARAIFLVGQDESKFKFLYDLTTARSTLDDGDYLSIKEIALLAGVDERTVRNSASSKENNKLITKKSGGSTIIENDEARRWLHSRPDFKPTQYIKDSTLDTPRYFEDGAGFGKYISYCMNNQGLSNKDVAQSLETDEKMIIDLQQGIDRFHIHEISKLATILNENSSEFVKDYMRIFHIKELADLLGYIYKSDHENPEKIENVRLMIFKKQLDTETESRFH